MELLIYLTCLLCINFDKLLTHLYVLADHVEEQWRQLLANSSPVVMEIEIKVDIHFKYN